MHVTSPRPSRLHAFIKRVAKFSRFTGGNKVYLQLYPFCPLGLEREMFWAWNWFSSAYLGIGNLHPLRTQDISSSSFGQLGILIFISDAQYPTPMKFRYTLYSNAWPTWWGCFVSPIEGSTVRHLVTLLFASLQVDLVGAQIGTVSVQEVLLRFSKT